MMRMNVLGVYGINRHKIVRFLLLAKLHFFLFLFVSIFLFFRKILIS